MSARDPRPAPLSEAVALQAAQWFLLLQGGDASERDHARWRQWHEADPLHAQAWQRAQRVGQKFAIVPRDLAGPALQRPGRGERRRAVKALALLLMAAPAGWLVWQQTPARDWLADARTARGERRSLVLADGSRVDLDTASAIDLRFDGEQRLLQLRAGAIHVRTAADPQPRHRPFIVATAEGRMQALGTRFTVRQGPGHTQVAVFEGAVRVQPAQAARDGSGALVLLAGQQAVFSPTEVQAVQPVAAHADAWVNGVLQVREMRLQDFAQALGRYRTGLLRCDPAVADLRISGAFQLDDTDAVLQSLPQALPVQVLWRTRYWVTLQAAQH